MKPAPRPGRARVLITLSVVALVLLVSAAEARADNTTFCIFDPGGANGDIFQGMKDFQTKASEWGVTAELRPYTNEATVVEDFKSGQCNAMVVTGTRARPFTPFASTIEAIGALPTYDLAKTAIKLLSDPRTAELMRSGDYETVGIIPTGAIYLMVRDRAVDTIEELAGKSIATLDFDEAAKVMVRVAGASITPADVTSFAGMFNNGSVDACYAPATAYAPLELGKGVGSGGGIVRYPIAQMTMHVVVRPADFPEGFGAQARDWFGDNVRSALRVVERAEQAIPASAWIEIPDADKARYDQLFLDVRVKLRDDHRVYNGDMLTLMRRLRCRVDASRAECAERRE